MVTENVDIQSVPDVSDAPAVTDDVPALDVPTSDVSMSDAPVGEVPGPPQPEGEAVVPAPVGEASGVPAPTETVPEVTPTSPQVPQYTPEQIQHLQQNAAQYQQMQQQATLQQQTNTYKSQLQQAGYLPEQAEHAANYYMQTQQQLSGIAQSANEYGRHLQGHTLEAESLAQKYGLGIGDLVTLRAYDDRVAMETAAQKISTDRKRDEELAEFKRARVPAQTVDNSQGNPTVAANEGSWLDRYNAGDRSPNSVAAARRAAGLS